jgi:hypothetical protein
MLVVVCDGGRMPRRCPGATAGRDEEKTTLIQEGEVGSKSSGFFLWPATCRASSGRWLARRAAWPGVLAPDSSILGGARASRRAPDESTPQNAPESLRRYAARSTARWQSHGRWPPGARARPAACSAARSTGADGQGSAWGPEPPRLSAASPLATAIPSSPRPAPGGPPRVSSCLVAEAPLRGGAVVLTFWVIQRVSCRTA